jgi:hypothetical protein
MLYGKFIRKLVYELLPRFQTHMTIAIMQALRTGQMNVVQKLLFLDSTLKLGFLSRDLSGDDGEVRFHR